MLTSQDIEKGLDFTGFLQGSAADHNQLVDLATPREDSATEGKGIVLWTNDFALDIPSTPDAGIITKWKRYLWIRIPVVGAAVKIPKVYTWNDDAVSDVLLLKWQEVKVDITELQAAIAAAQLTADNAQTTANNASTTATAANNNANNALVTANAANATATNAATAAVTAQSSADTALANAATADAKAVVAQTTATAAQNTANTAQALASINRTNKYVKISYRGVTETLTNPNEWNRLELDTEVHDAGGLAALAGNVITLNAGTYFVDAFIPSYDLRKTTLMLGNDSDNAVLIKGADSFFGGAHAQVIRLTGVFTIAAVKNISLYLYATNNGNLGYGDEANVINSNTGLPVGYAAVTNVNERYQIEFFKLD